MNAVRGTVASSKSISLSKAGAALSDFVDSGVCSRGEIAAYLSRASAAFDELVGFHREIKDAQKKDQHSTCKVDGESRSGKKRMRSEVEAGDHDAIRGAYANSVSKRRIFASGSKLVDDGNAIGFNGGDEKRNPKKEITREINEKKGIYFQMDLKGHEKDEKNMKGSDNGELYHVAKNNFDKKKGLEASTEHRNAMEKKMKKARHEDQKQDKRKREGDYEYMSNPHENDISYKNVDFKSEEKKISSKNRNNINKHEEKGLNDISERHKKKKRRKEQADG